MFLPLKSRWVAGAKSLEGTFLAAFGVLALACGTSGLRAQIPAELSTGANSWNVRAVDFVGVDAMMTEKVNDIGYWWDDMLHLLSHFGCEVGCTASMNDQDLVNITDLLMYLSVFGAACP